MDSQIQEEGAAEQDSHPPEAAAVRGMKDECLISELSIQKDHRHVAMQMKVKVKDSAAELVNTLRGRHLG